MNVHIEILSVNVPDQQNKSIIWQGQHVSKLADFTDNKELVFSCPSHDENSIFLNAFIGTEIFKRESLCFEQNVSVSREHTRLEISFGGDSQYPISGTVSIQYRCEPVTNPDKVRFHTMSGFLFNFSIDALNTLFEPPLEAMIQVYNAHNQLITKAAITNAMHTLLLPITSQCGENGLIIVFTETLNGRSVSRSYLMSLAPLQTVVYSLSTTSNKILAVEMNLLRKREALSAMYHSAVFREGLIVADTQQKARISLTPRRASSIHAGNPGVMLGNMSARQSVAGAVKYILYMNDESISVHQDSFASITEHFIQATPHPSKDIAAVLEARTQAGDIMRLDGPGRLHGTYMVCSSKSDIVEGIQDALPKKGKNKRKALQNICLGLAKLDRSYLNGPVKLRASILKVEFQITSEVTSEGIFDTTKPLEYTIHKSIFFSGTIKESSREIFSDTGLLSCTLEGTLFRPDEAAHINAPGSYHETSGSNPPSPRREGESCMAFKVYMSLIHGDAEASLDNESELLDDEDATDGPADKILQDELAKRDAEKERNTTQAAATQEGAEYNRTDGNVEDGELAAVSTVNVPAPDSKTLMAEFQAQKSPSAGSNHPSQALSKQASAEKVPTRAASAVSTTSPSPSPSPSLVPPLSLDKLQQGSREKLILNGLEVNRLEEGAAEGGGAEAELPGKSVSHAMMRDSSSHSTASSKKSLHPSSSSPSSHVPSTADLQHELRQQAHQSLSEGEARLVHHPSSTSSSQKSLPQPPFGHLHPESQPLVHQPLRQASMPMYSSMGMVKPQNALAFADMIREQLAEKQRLIEKLMKELDEKYEAIQLCGKDIRELREERWQLQGQIKDLQGAVGENYAAEQAASAIASRLLAPDGGGGGGVDGGGGDHHHRELSTDALLHDASNKTLLRVVHRLQLRMDQYQQDERSMQHRLQSQQDEIGQLRTAEQEWKNLQERHEKQTRYVQYIDKDIAKIDLYRRTIKTQEKMIARLQNVMESKLKSKFTALRAQASRFSFDDDGDGEENHGDGGFDASLVHQPKPPRQHHQHRHPRHHPHHQQHQHQHQQQRQEDVESLASVPIGAAAAVSEVEAQQQSQIIELEDKVRSLEEQLAQVQQQLQIQEVAALQQQQRQQQENNNNRKEDDDLPVEDEEEEERDGDDAFDPHGRHPAKFKNVKDANARIDLLVAESMSKDFRVTAMEQQLEQSTRTAAKEMAQLRTKIFELEMTVATFSGMDLRLDDGQQQSMPDFFAGFGGDVDPEAIPSSKHPHIDFRPANGVEDAVVSSAPPATVPSNASLPPTMQKDRSELDLSKVSYEVTRQESIVDIDRLATPPEGS